MSKIVLHDFRNSTSVILPKTGLEVVLYNSLLVGDILGENIELNNLEKTDNALKIVVKTIKSWNLYKTEADAEPLPITVENLKLLPIADFAFLNEQIKTLALAEKKS